MTQPSAMSQKAPRPPNGVGSAPLTPVQGALKCQKAASRGLILLLPRLLEEEVKEVKEVEHDVEKKGQ